MKVFSVAGYHRTGKTTVVVNLIKELKSRGYKVVSIKDIHNEDFTMEKEGSNSWKHWQASDEVVIASGLNETYQIWHRKLNLNEMLEHFSADFVVVEGMKSAPLPKIICAENSKQLDELIDGTIFAISGKFADSEEEYKDLPVFNSNKNIKELTDLVEQKVFEVLPLSESECCMECGFTCTGMVAQILKENKNRDDCKTDRKTEINLKIDRKDVKIVPFVQKTLKDIILAYLQNLKGYEKGKKIEIIIDE